MEDSSLIPPKIKEYCCKFNIEKVINDTLNEALSTLPADPFSFLCGKFKENSQFIYKIISLNFREALDSNLNMKQALDVTLSFQGTSKKILTFFLPYSNNVYKMMKDKQDTSPFIEIYNKLFKQKLENYTIEQFISLDKLITGIVELSNSEDEKQISKNLGMILSNSLLLAMSLMSHDDITSIIENKLAQYKISSSTIPDLGFILFKTGKEVNSKVKFEKWLLFISNKNELSYEELVEIYMKVYNSIRKVLTAGKAGENGMRLSDEGYYYPPTDSMNDIMKLLETIIADTGVNTNDNEILYYGIDCNGNNFYSNDSKLYDMEGFKKQPDTEQMIEFYIKLFKDHPLLRYVEDPLSDLDLRGNSNLMEKLMTECPNVELSLKRMIIDNIPRLNEILDQKEEEEEEEEEEDNINSPEKKTIDANNNENASDIVEDLTEGEKIKKQKEEEEKRKKAEEEAQKLLEEQRLKEEEEAKNAKGKKKPEPKKPEPKKPNAKKTEEELRKEKEEQEKLLPPPIPFVNLKNISVQMDNCCSISDLGNFTKKARVNDIGLTLYDFTYEGEESSVIDLGIGLRANRIIINGLGIKSGKVLKVREYLENITKLYKEEC